MPDPDSTAPPIDPARKPPIREAENFARASGRSSGVTEYINHVMAGDIGVKKPATRRHAKKRYAPVVLAIAAVRPEKKRMC